jgi:predicted amidohydrolase YtcJ
MIDLRRRDVLKSLAALPLVPLRRAEPDLVLFNGLFYTMNAAQPEAGAVAIRDGRILAVGASSKDVLPLANSRTRRVDLGGPARISGFQRRPRAPCLLRGLQQLTMVACDSPSIEVILAALRERAAATPQGAWVRGFLYDDGKTPRPC